MSPYSKIIPISSPEKDNSHQLKEPESVINWRLEQYFFVKCKKKSHLQREVINKTCNNKALSPYKNIMLHFLYITQCISVEK